MQFSTLLLAFFSITELLLLGIIIVFFVRLKKSEALLNKLSQGQAEFVNKLHFNAQLEQEMINSFSKRQEELSALDEALDTRAKELSKLLTAAEKILHSPAIKRQTVIEGHRKGRSPLVLAKATGLTLEEVEIIIDQES